MNYVTQHKICHLLKLMNFICSWERSKSEKNNFKIRKYKLKIKMNL